MSLNECCRVTEVLTQSLFRQRSVVQATSQITKTEPGTQALSVTSLQPVHISPEVNLTPTHSHTSFLPYT